MALRSNLLKLTYSMLFICVGIDANAPAPGKQTPHPTTLASASPKPLHMAAKPQIWNLKDADIRAVIQTISMATGKSFIVDPRVKGNVTFVSHKPMNSDELYNAFLSMLQVLNFVAVPDGNAMRIIPSVDANGTNNQIATHAHPGAGAHLVVRVVPINHVSAIQLMPALRPLMPQWSSLTAYSPSNSIIIASTAANVNHLVDIIKSMDSTTQSQTQMIALENANAQDVADVIIKLQAGERSIGKTPTISIAPDAASNSILVSGNLNNIASIRALIQKMDDMAKINSDTSKVVHLKYLSAKKIAPILGRIANGEATSTDGNTANASDTSTGSSANSTDTATTSTSNSNNTNNTDTGGSSNISVQAEPNVDDAIIIRAPRHIMQQLLAVIKKLDVKPQQVLVQAIIVRMDQSLLDQLGISWSTAYNNSGTVTTYNSPSGNSFPLKISKSGVGIIAGGDIQAVISTLKSDASTDILSTPSIVVLNGQEASISDGKNIGIINRSYQGSDGSATSAGVPFNTIERKDVTLSLTVTPHISPDNMLRLMIKQQDESLSQSTGSSSTLSDNPTFNTSKINTNVLVHSNDILVLGGLVDHQATKSRNKIPVLGDIPLLGHLFRYSSNDTEKKDLMVFLKPIIINTDYERNKLTVDRYHYMRRKEIAAEYSNGLSRDDLPVIPNVHQGNTEPQLELPAPVRTVNPRYKRYD